MVSDICLCEKTDSEASCSVVYYSNRNSFRRALVVFAVGYMDNTLADLAPSQAHLDTSLAAS